MRKLIVTTTINEPTKATQMFAKMNGWDFLVVGDKKTPHDKYKNYNYPVIFHINIISFHKELLTPPN